MGTLHLVRHGQASFGADDYDQLSPRGEQQCRHLGEWFAAQGLRFDAVMTGTLKRHRQSLAAIAAALPGLPAASEWPGLNEYDSEAVIRTVHPGPLSRERTPETFRHHFRLLREGLLKWAAGEVRPEGMPTHRDFVAGIVEALTHVQGLGEGHVLLVSSGGPISHAIGHVLGVPVEGVVELNLRLRNSALTQFQFTPKRHALLTWNTLPHLDDPARHGLHTYA